MSHPYPRQPLASTNTPWQNPGAVMPGGRQMLAGWRPPTAMANGMPPANLGTSLEQKQDSVHTNQAGSNQEGAQKLANDIDDKNVSTSGVPVSAYKEAGMCLNLDLTSFEIYYVTWCQHQFVKKYWLHFSLGEFFRSNRKKSNLMPWRQTPMT